MAIPKFQTIMLPLLKTVNDGKSYSIQELFDSLSKQFELSDDEKSSLLPSGNEEIFRNRLRWSRFYLLRAGLISDPKRGKTQITSEGAKFLTSNPVSLDVGTLSGFGAFAEVKSSSKSQSIEVAVSEDESETPEESIEFGFQRLKKQLQAELLERIKSSSPKFFERLVVELMVRLGYGGSLENPGTVTGKAGDEGIDGVIKEDRLGLDLLYIQAKRWDKNAIARDEVQKFVGALHGKKARKGIFITTSTFAKSAVDYAENMESKVILIDGEKLTDLMFETGLGLSTVNTYQIKKIDSDFFSDEDFPHPIVGSVASGT